jgi:hypothetical protein
MNDFKWFTGVVEDNNDPQERGRVKVRAIGYHTPDDGELPTASLPWATPLMPVTSASMSGIGASATGLLPGSWVMGFFRDGENCQDPVVVGSIPGNSTRQPIGSTFADSSGTYPKRNGVDTPEIATSNYKNSSAYSIQTQTDHKTIENAVPPTLSSIDSTAQTPVRGSWTPPSISDTVKPVYPHNSVNRTSSGHVIEIDDTPGAERISEMHCSGTMRQIDAAGNSTTTIVGSSYKIVVKDDNVFIQGSCNLTIAGSCKTLVRGNYDLEVEGDYNVNVKGSIKTKAGGNVMSEHVGLTVLNAGSHRETTINGNDRLTVGALMSTDATGAELNIVNDYELNTFGTRSDFTGAGFNNVVAGAANISSSGNTTITAPKIDLNP